MSFPRYPKYKDSGVEWLGQVPDHWEVCPIKRIVRMQSGESITAEGLEETGEYPVFGGNGLRGYSSAFTHDGHYVLIGRQGALCGNINYGRGKFWASEHAVVVSPTKQVETVWLGEMMRTMNLNQYSVSAAQPGLSVDLVGRLGTIVPPLAEQAAIATFLDRETAKIDALVAEQQRLMELLKEKRQAVISQAVTKGLDTNAPMKPSSIEWLGDVPAHWDVVALKHLVAQPIIDGPHESPEKLDEGIPFVSAESVSKGCIDFDKIWGYISHEDHARYSKRYKPQRGDILLVKLGATTGTPAIVETDTDFNVWVPLAAIRPKPEIESRFVFHVLRSDIDGDGPTNTISYVATNAYSTNLISQVTDPFGRSALFYYDETGYLTNIADVAGMSSSFRYSVDTVTNMTTPYGTTGFTTTEASDPSTSVSGRSVLISEPDGSRQLYLYKDHAPGVVADYSYPNFATNVPDTGPFQNGFQSYNLDIRNTFHWGARQYAALSTTNITSFTTNDFRKARRRHWVFAEIAVGPETLLLEGEPSPSATGDKEGQKTWLDFSYVPITFGGWTQPSPLVLPANIAMMLPGGTNRFTHYFRNASGIVTNEVSTYSVNGTVLLRTNIYVYDANFVDLLAVTNAAGVRVLANIYNDSHQVLTNFNALGERTVFNYNTNQQHESETFLA